jgi:D-alanyl-D-alanine carboxypeptidase/Putative peptidoglycan binding domain
MKALTPGLRGAAVRKWQIFLRGQRYQIIVNGIFDAATETATRAFQKKHTLEADGLVGNQTVGKAAMLGFEVIDFISLPEAKYPPKPTFLPLADNAQRQSLFGPLAFVAAPVSNNPENIQITNGWDRENIRPIQIPPLVGIKGAPITGNVFFHRKAHVAIATLFSDWHAAGLTNQILSWAGAYSPRFIRGSDKVLSNHAFGTAFDINVKWNPLGVEPAWPGEEGCVFDLVSIANKNGFYWGGHFTRRDGMHFEVAQI